ncbi:MAG TPA: tripartite tricarboxylate transporter substrate binding protein [Burkholderiales bacterium]|nr:tripartite tricarboxylate transporter substrate binding protein [Burkholderiales bacterium]
MRLLVSLLLAFCTTIACGQNYPTRAVRLVVGFPAGGPSDIPARLIAERIRVPLGQPVVVENKTGAAGMIAANDVLSQPADGHTLLLCSYIDPLNTLLYNKVSYRLDDLAPVSLVSKAYYAFTISSEVPAASLAQFVSYAKARPGTLNYGRVGAGSVTELLARQFEKLAGISMTGIDFKGTGPALQEIVAGRVHFIVGPLFVTMPLYQGKKVKILGMTSPERLTIAPEVPTLVEQGLPIVNYGWWGVCARSGMPQPVVEVLNRHVVAAVGSAEYRTAMERTGVIPVSSTPAELGQEISKTVRETSQLFRELDIRKID